MLRAPARRGGCGSNWAATGGKCRGAELVGATTGAAARAGAGAASGTAGSASGDGAPASGSTRVKTLPSPGVLCKWIDPPSSCARSRENRQAQARAAVLCGGCHRLAEGSKISSPLVRRDADARVLTANDRRRPGCATHAVPPSPSAVNLSALDSRFFQHLPQALRVGVQRGPPVRRGDGGRQRQALLLRQRAQRVDQRLQGPWTASPFPPRHVRGRPLDLGPRSRMSLIRASRSSPAA